MRKQFCLQSEITLPQAIERSTLISAEHLLARPSHPFLPSKAVRAAYAIGAKPTKSIQMNGRARKPDGLTEDTLSEVKNVGKLSFTRQLRDYLAYAMEKGLSFNLYTRPNTKLSNPLRDAIDTGHVKQLDIP